METTIFLLVDGLANSAIYVLVALSLVIVHTTTRVTNVGQGEYVMLGAMTLASFMEGHVPPTVGLLFGGGVLCVIFDLMQARRSVSVMATILLKFGLWCLAVFIAVWMTMGAFQSYLMAMVCALFLVSMTGPVIYRLTVQPAMHANHVVLLIISVGVQMVVHGLALVLWGAEPLSVPEVSDEFIVMGPLFLSSQTIMIILVSMSVVAALYVFFEKTLLGKALRAAAINQRGAELCGISVRKAGAASYALAACLSGASGMMLAPLVTANVDMGFVVGLKGFVGATFSGLMTYPLSVVGVIFVGIVDSFSAYWSSAYRDALVFSLILPVLLWRSGLRRGNSDR